MTPYVTVPELLAAPTGISWSSIPGRQASPAAQIAEQTNICWRATHQVDEYCNQALRATLDTETLTGPDARLTVQGNGIAQFITERWPVLAVIGGQVSPSTAFPPQWQQIPANQFVIHSPALGFDGSAASGAAGAGASRVEIAPGWVGWFAGRNGYRVQVTYVNGWPHSGLTAGVAAGVLEIPVDDCTGWAVNGGVSGTFRDGDQTETISVASASVQSGPGTLTLASPTAFPHVAGIAFTSMPWSVQQATILYATSLALLRGAMAVTAQALPGSQSQGGKGAEDIVTEAEVLLDPYRRIF